MNSAINSALEQWKPGFELKQATPEIKKYVALGEKYNEKVLTDLNSELAQKVFLVGLDLSAADVALALAMRDDLAKRAKGKKTNLYSDFSNVCRWFDFVQHQIPEILGKPVDLKQEIPVAKKPAPKKQKKQQPKKTESKKAEPKKKEPKPQPSKPATEEKAPQKAQQQQGKKKKAKKQKKSAGRLTDHLGDIDWLEHRIQTFERIYNEQQAAKEAAVGEIKITLPSGDVKEGIKGGTSPWDIAKQCLPKARQKEMVIAKVTSADHPQGKLWDLSRPLESDCKLELLDFDTPEGTETFWHSSSHVLGEALERLYKGKLTKGPPLPKDLCLSQGGFYYDVALDDDVVVSEQDYKDIEKLVQKKITSGKGQEFQRIFLTKDQALDMFQENRFKQEIIKNRIPDGAEITAYRCGPLIDLCRGPHIPSTKMIKTFKVVKNSASNWDNKSTGATLQRVYGITFPDKNKMKEWQENKKKAEEADHRKKGKDLKLFFFDDISPGCCFWLPHGARVFNTLVGLMRSEYLKRGYSEVVTPNMYSMKLWEISGHAAKYRDDMFLLDVEEQEFGLKPMNCPGHCVMFRRFKKSYRDLPIRMADFGVLHRNEASGALTGLTRVRRFQQDDAHIFCRLDQVEEEVEGVLDFLEHIYGIFNFKFELALSTRNVDTMIGKTEVWDRAEASLEKALKKFCDARPDKIKGYGYNPGDAAFYGPKIDIEVFDCMGRKHQCATVQLDFVLPERFELEYTTKDNTVERPVMIHRALLGSVERFTAILLEHCGGKLPLWVSPRQVCVIPVALDYMDYATKVNDMLVSRGFFSDIDDSRDRLPKKVRNAQKIAYNVLVVVGQEDIDSESVTVRLNRSEESNRMKINDFVEWLVEAKESRQCEW